MRASTRGRTSRCPLWCAAWRLYARSGGTGSSQGHGISAKTGSTRASTDVWRQRGAFPGAGGMLEALGCRLGTSFVMELLASGTVGMLEDPWPLVDSMLRGQSTTPAPYALRGRGGRQDLCGL